MKKEWRAINGKIKKIELIILSLFSLIILFFSIFGEDLYYSTKPNVKLTRIVRRIEDNNSFLIIPKDAYFDGYIFTIESESGFSTTHYTAKAIPVQVEQIDSDLDFLKLISGAEIGTTIIACSDRHINDGDRIVKLN